MFFIVSVLFIAYITFSFISLESFISSFRQFTLSSRNPGIPPTIVVNIGTLLIIQSNNTLGNPVRDPVVSASGDDSTGFVLLSDAATNSGGVLIEGVLEDGTPVQYLKDAFGVGANSYYMRSEENLVDASYFRFKEFRVGYNLPSSLLSNFAVVGANIGLSVRNVAFLDMAEKGIDPTTASNGHGDGFSYWEGGVLPSTRVVSLSLKLTF